MPATTTTVPTATSDSGIIGIFLLAAVTPTPGLASPIISGSDLRDLLVILLERSLARPTGDQVALNYCNAILALAIISKNSVISELACIIMDHIVLHVHKERSGHFRFFTQRSQRFCVLMRAKFVAGYDPLLSPFIDFATHTVHQQWPKFKI